MDPAYDVWDIKDAGIVDRRRSRDVEAARRAIFELGLREWRANFLCFDDTDTLLIEGVTPTPITHVLHLSPQLGHDELERKGLYLGGWILYSATNPLAPEELPSAFDLAADRLLGQMRSRGLGFLLSSFWDDIEWRLAVAEDPPGPVAA